MYWDASSLIPLLVDESKSNQLRSLLRSHPTIVTWWGSPVECYSSIYRKHREQPLVPLKLNVLIKRTQTLMTGIDFVSPSKLLKDRAIRLLAVHSLRAADSFQLAAALIWCQEQPSGRVFVCLDDRLRTAAEAEGFIVLPT